jgi:glycerophosphoryl diester phosphodiesterase
MTRPLLLGHRGARASREIPENTLASFELSLQHGCDGFEFDVRRSSDGQAVICHDPEAGGLEIARTPAKNLALPSLEEVLRSFGSRAFLDIELKVGGVEADVVALLQQHPPQNGCVVSSFLPEVITTISDLETTIPLGFLCEKLDELRRWRDLRVAWVIPKAELADQALLREAHEAGQKVMVWTVNRVEAMREFAKWGADAVISDETELLGRSLR